METQVNTFVAEDKSRLTSLESTPVIKPRKEVTIFRFKMLVLLYGLASLLPNAAILQDLDYFIYKVWIFTRNANSFLAIVLPSCFLR